jgi:serine/threonine protein kinase
MTRRKLVKYHISGTEFLITENYKDLKNLGSGAYGIAVAAYDSDKKRHVAIKKIPIEGQDFEFLKRVLREVCILKHFSPHTNLIM